MRVVVADDQNAVREGLVTLLSTMAEVEVVGSAGDGEQALAVVAQTAPDVVLMDLRMPRLDGVEATRRIRAAHPGTAHPGTQVVVLTTYADDQSIIDALRAGAIGYLTKDAGRDHIRRAIQAAAAGQAVLDPAVQARLAQVAHPPSAAPAELPDGLTDREAQVPRPRRWRFFATDPGRTVKWTCPSTSTATMRTTACADWLPATEQLGIENAAADNHGDVVGKFVANPDKPLLHAGDPASRSRASPEPRFQLTRNTHSAADRTQIGSPTENAVLIRAWPSRLHSAAQAGRRTE